MYTWVLHKITILLHHLTTQNAEELQHKVLNTGVLKAKKPQHVMVHQWQSEKICLKRHVQLHLFVSVVHVLSSGLLANLS